MAYIKKPTVSKNAELVIVTFKANTCQTIARMDLPYSISASFDGIEAKTGRILNKPTMTFVQKYLMVYPDPKNSSEHLLYGIANLFAPPYNLEFHSNEPLTVPGLSGGIHHEIINLRTKDEEYALIYSKESPEGKVTSIHGYEITFDKDKTEELNTFKMPIMFVGVGVALAYQIFCKGKSLKKPSRFSEPKGGRAYDRTNRVNQMDKRIDNMRHKLR